MNQSVMDISAHRVTTEIILSSEDEDEYMVVSQKEISGTVGKTNFNDTDDNVDEQNVDSPARLTHEISSTNASMSSIEIPETDEDVSDSEDDVVTPNPIARRIKSRNRHILYSSDEEGEAAHERRAYSPRTRMSMTGIIPANYSLSGSDSDLHSLEDHDTSAPSSSIADRTAMSGAMDFSFVDLDKIDEQKVSTHNAVSDDSVELVDMFNAKLLPAQHPPLVQPKITTLISSTPIKGKTAKSVELKAVSAMFYNTEAHKLEDLKTQLWQAQNILKTAKHRLVDGGAKMDIRVKSLEKAIALQAANLENMFIEEKKVETRVKPNENWDDLKKATESVLPQFAGRVGMANFNKQKTLTLDKLQELHGSLNACPTEEVLADEPKGLKVSLMLHQRHALAWMNWRESQKPRGGILADDMGLGKTLAMISLTLAALSKDPSSGSDSDGSDSNEANKKWTTKGRQDYHKGGTLVVAPATLIRQWEQEVNKRVRSGLLSVLVHHGTNREYRARKLSKFSMVITTYNIVMQENKSRGAIFGVRWNRIILDEAHVVRNHMSVTSVAVCKLIGKYRWALTGTPIQNKMMDMFALIKFLKCAPFDDIGHWKKWIESKSAGGQQRLNTLMKSIMLRRTKVQLQIRGDLNSLPQKEVRIVDVALEKDEMNVYQTLLIFSKSLFTQFLMQRDDRTVNISHKEKLPKEIIEQHNQIYQNMFQKHMGQDIKAHHILTLLLRLRQICCHPGLIDAILEDEILNTDQSERPESDSSINIFNQFQQLTLHPKSDLPDSNDGTILPSKSNVLVKSNPVFNLNNPSSKIKTAIDIIEKEVLAKGDKAVVVSQWISVLNIVATQLQKRNISHNFLTGQVPVKDRNDLITDFNKTNSGPVIMLLSLAAGGVGLNLAAGNHLLLLDLHWNPQLEAQAQDRIYRLGQTKSVVIYKLFCGGTIEQQIKNMQDCKLSIAENILTGNKASGSGLSIEELKKLFEMD